MNNSFNFPYDFSNGYGNNRQIQGDVDVFLTKTTTPEEFDKLCKQNPKYQLANLPGYESCTHHANELHNAFIIELKKHSYIIQFEEAAKKAISLMNNRLLFHIVNKIGNDLITLKMENSKTMIKLEPTLLRITLETAFNQVDEINELFAYHAVKKMIQFGVIVSDSTRQKGIFAFNFEGALDLAIKTRNVSLVTLLLKNQVISNNVTENLDTFENAINHIVYQQTMRSETLEKILFRFNFMGNPFSLTLNGAKIISEYCEGDAFLDEDLDREFFFDYVISNVSGLFPNELTKLILEYAGNYDAVL